jgi:threonine dehydratase
MEVTVKDIDEAAKRIKDVAQNTPLQYSKRLSKKYQANIYIKREDLQEVRSFKIRGAYNKMASLTKDEQKRGVVTASAGNHAQGVAYGCAALKIKGVIFMPVVTPNQKIEKVKHFGGKYVEIKLVGNTFDDASIASKVYAEENNMGYVHPFNDPFTIAGQGTVGKEIYEKLDGKLDYVVATIGGGGLISGISTYLKGKNKSIKCIGSEPDGAACMYEALRQGKVVTLEKIDTFVDGAAVKTAGDLTFKICKQNLEKVVTIPSGKDCTTMIELYQNEGIIAEPAGAIAVAALDDIAPEIKGKTVVCIISGGNNDILRYPEIMEKSLVYQGRKHYFIIDFAQKPGQLKRMVNEALGPTDDIVRFEYIKKTNKEKGPALVGIELKDKKDLLPLLERMKEIELKYSKITNSDLLYDYLV